MKKLTLILIGFFAFLTVSGGEVTEQQALQKARQFMKGRTFVRASLRRASQNAGGGNAFYVFNAENNGGYVIVSGDDRTHVILAYSEQGNLDMSTIPDNLRWWLDSYASQIAALGTTLQAAPQSRHSAQMTAIAPLVTAKWNQDEPYNYMCPDGNSVDYYEDGYNSDNRCMTGCVATAMAQVMYYWHWPNECPALSEYWTPYGRYVKGLPATAFKWDKMKDSYTKGETGESADAVAELMRYCGQTVHMEYGTSSSGAKITPKDMTTAFQYSKNSRCLSRDNYLTGQWETIVYEELVKNRPVLYTGYTKKSAGHEFIIDGYDGNGLFHINWGWGGSPDSYYVLSLADPGLEQGIGGSNSPYEYNQVALIGLEPSEPGEVVLPHLASYMSLSTQISNYTRSSSSENFVDVSLAGRVDYSYTVTPSSESEAEIGWALYQDDAFRQVLGSQSVTLKVFDNRCPNNMTLSFGASLADGRYRLYQVYRLQGETDWKRCDDFGRYVYIADVAGTTLSVRTAMIGNVAFEVNDIITSPYPEVNSKVDVVANVTNTGDSYRLKVGMYIQRPNTSAWTTVKTVDVLLDPGQTADVNFSFVPNVAGTYGVKITTGNLNEVMKTSTINIAANETVIVDGLAYLCVPEYKRAKVVADNNANKSATHVTIKEQVTASGVSCNVCAINAEAFYNWTELTSVVIPESIESIGEKAFFGNTSLMSVQSYIQNPPTINDNTFIISRWNSETNQFDHLPSPATLYVPVGTKAKYEALSGWRQFAKIEEGEMREAVASGLKYSYSTGGTTATVLQDDSYQSMTTVTIPATVTLDGKSYRVTAIGKKAFYYCYYLTSVTLPEGLESIGDYAFFGCDYVTQMTVPRGVKTIGEYAFSVMRSMTSLELPRTLKQIGIGVLNRNENLVEVVSRITRPFAVSDKTFALSVWNGEIQGYEYVPSPATLYVPAGSKAKYEALSGWRWFAKIEEYGPEIEEGDANGDGDVSITDAVAIVNYILGNPSGNFNEDAADVNCDGKVTITDAVAVVVSRDR